ncbi:MAG TPA: hypothetical protein DIT25_00560 [Candidatus Moranbacteria bacterium]|nr:hypothetical protein [Candidatus Moranbacteria bacterium]
MSLTFEGGEYSEKDLFGEVREAATRERVSSIVQYRDLIDEIVEEKRIYGFFSDHEDIEQIKGDLEARWSEIEKDLARSEEVNIP